MKSVKGYKAGLETILFPVKAQAGWEQSDLHPSLSFQHPVIHPHHQFLHTINLSEEEWAHVWALLSFLVALSKGAHVKWHPWAGSEPWEKLSGGSIIFWLAVSSGLQRLQQGFTALFSLLSIGLHFNECLESHSALLCCAKGHNSVTDLRPEPLCCKACPTITLTLCIALMYKTPWRLVFLLTCNDAVHVGPKHSVRF